MRHLELKHLMSEGRMLSILLGGALLQDMVDPVLLITSVPSSLLTRVAVMTGHPVMLAGLFALCALLLAPYLAASLVRSFAPHRRMAAKLACLSLCIATVLWAFMGTISAGLGTGTVSNIFIRNAIMSLGFAAALAITLNNQLIRRCREQDSRHGEGAAA